MSTSEKEGARASAIILAGSVNKILKIFKTNITSLLFYYQNFEGLTQDADKSEADKYTSRFADVMASMSITIPMDSNDKGGLDLFSKKMREIVEKEPEKILDAIENLSNSKTRVLTKNFEIFSRGAFIMLNNYFEYLLSDLISYYYNKYQGSLKDKKFDFTLKELNEYESIAEVVKAFITQEVESLMVKLTFDELLEHFEKHLKINNEKDLINWEAIQECRERRHLIVHNASKVNKKYIIRTGNPYNFSIGDTVHIDKEYFLKSCNNYYLGGLIVSYNCWGEWDKKDITSCIKNLLDESFELLKNDENEVSLKVTTYAKMRMQGRTDRQDDLLARVGFNRLIALKRQGNKVELQKELKEIKVGTMAPTFKLAYAILADEHKDILMLIKQVKLLGDLKMRQYQSWPIYEFLRNDADLDKAICELLQEEPAASSTPESNNSVSDMSSSLPNVN